MSHQSLLRRLEPRIVFDGAALATGIDAVADQPDATNIAAPLQDAEAPLPDFSADAAFPTEIVVVDSRIKDADLLIEGLSANAQVFILDPSSDGIAQITDILSQQGGLSAIHIFSHGDAGKLFLGDGELSAANIGDNAEALAGWGEALSANGDLLLWGCDVAASSEGARFVSDLAVLTGADVAASVDTTGAASLGGDWVLEANTGSVEADSPFGLASLMAYAHVLNTVPQITTGGAETVNEDTTLTFSGGNQISIADIDGDNLSMTLSVTNGTLILGGTANLTGLSGNGTNTVTFQGLAADVTTALNGLSYQGTANFNGADSLSVQANDGTATSNSAIGITVSAVEDGPQLVANSITVPEGNTPAAVTLQTSDLQVTDAESAAADLTYSLVSLPTDGTLRVNGAVATLATTFTQADIDSGNVNYTHNGAENATDSLTFNVTDGAAQQLGNTAFTINVTAANDPLVEVAVADTVVTEGQAVTIGEINLDYSDVDTADSALIYTVTAGSVLSEGTLTAGGLAIGIGGTFTQAQINANQVVFTHGGTETAATQKINFSVSDGTTSNTGTVNIAVTPVNDDPVVSTPGLTVAEGGSSSFASTNLNITDPDSSDEQIIYKIESLPTNGTLTIGGNPVVVGTTFSQAQLTTLSYAHNGGETTSDTFNFTARDGAGGVIATTAMPITITPVNDPVTASGSATVFEGQSASISLNIGDNDDAAANITVRIDSLPTDGTLFFNGVAVATVPQSFTADQANLLTYTHNGSDGVSGDPADTSFDITVTDNGGGTATPSSVSTTINIDVQAVDDDPTLPTNAGATVAEGGTLTLNNTQLSATDVDSPDATLTYQVESLPTSGFMELNGVRIGVGATFTQADIDAGNVKYVNQSQTAGTDSFTFTLRDGQINIITALQGALRQTPGGALDVQTFNINITEVDDAPVLTQNSTQEITQGGTVTVTAASLNATDVDSTDANTIFTVTTVPANGELQLNGTALTNGQTFTLDDVKNSRVTYVHTTAQPTGGDSFQFQLTDNTGLPVAPATVTHNFTVTPDPVIPDNTGSGSNPTLTTNSGLTVAEHGTVSLTGALSFADDQPAANLIYRITSDAQHGQVLLNGAGLGVGSLFTQADIDAGLVTFQSDGTNDTAATQTNADSFTVTLIDGDGGTVTGINVGVTITPVNDAPVVTVPTSITTSEDISVNVTGVSVADIDEDATPGAELQMTLSATAGALTLSTKTGLVFTTGDGTSDASMVFTGTRAAINTALATLSYLPNSNVSGSDTITVTANDQGNTGTGGALSDTETIAVTTLEINDAPTIGVNVTLTTTLEGGLSTITNSLLAAADTDNGTTEQFFVITSLPADGTLLLNGTALTTGGFFTQDDINNNRVTYQHNGTENFRDTFNFTLTDGSSSAVTGTFNLEIIPQNDTPTVPTNTGMILTEAQTKVITAAMLTVGDADGSAEIGLAEDIETFTITTAPTTGTILLDGTAYAGEALTNAIVAAGRLSYQHNGTETFTDSMVITVNDNSATAGASHTTTATFNFVIAPLNDDPVVANNVALVVEEGGSGTIGSTQLGSATTSTVDPDNNERQVQYRVTSNVSTGQLFLNGNAIGVGSSVTLEDIQQNRLTYTHNGDEVYADAFDFRIEDGGGGFVDGTYNITVNAINDTPVLTVPGAQSVDEDTNLAITGVSVVDPDATQGTDQVTATLSVTSGTITLATDSGLNFNLGSNGSSSMTIQGTLAEVNAAIATLTYKGNPNFNGSDTLNINFNDLGNFGTDPGNSGDGTNEQADASIAITVGPINDAPTVTPPGTQSVTEDQTLTLSGATAIVIGDVDHAVTITGYDVTNATISGTGFWRHVYTGTITPTANALYSNYSGGSGTLADGVKDDTTHFMTHLFYETATIESTITLFLDSTYTLSSLSLFGGDHGPRNSIPGAITGVDVTIGGMTVTIASTQFGMLGLSGQLVNDLVTLTGTGLELIATDQVILSNFMGPPNFTSATVGLGANVYSIAEIEIAGSASVPEPATLGLVALGLAGLGLIGDVDADDTAGDTLTVTVNATNGTLTLATNSGLTGVSGDGSKSVTFTGTRAEVNAALDGLIYDSDLNFAGADTINVSVNDNGNTGSGGAKTGSGSLTVNVNPVNDTPAVTVPADKTAPEDTALVFSSGNTNLIQITDVDAGTGLIDVTIALSGATPGAVTLSQTTGLSFESGSNGSSSMTVRGTLANINAALAGMNYQGPANANGFTTTVTVSVDDRGNTGTDPGLTGDGTSEIDSATFDITVPAVNDAPTITPPGAQTAVEDDAAGVTFGNIGFGDVDAVAGTDVLTVTLSVANGTVTLSAAAVTSIGAGNVTNNDTGTVTVTGTLNQLNAAINAANSVTYVANANFAGADPMTITINDGGATGGDPTSFGLPGTGTGTTEEGTATVAINVTAVNDAPTITVPTAQSVNEDTNLVLTGATAISIADIDSSTSDVTATLTVTSGTLTANGATGTLTSITGQGTNTLTLVGTASEINTAIASLTYVPTANANGTDTLNINVNDGGNTGVDPSTVGQTATGGATDEQANASVGLTINAINDTPTVTVPGQQTAATAAGVTFSNTNGNQISVADVDANEVSPTAVVRATIAVTSGTLNLNGTSGLNFISGSTGSGSMVVEGTIADINTALNGMSFIPGGDADTTATLSVTLNDKGNVGADPNLTGDGSSEEGTGNVSILISEINDAPTITAPATAAGSEDTVVTFTGGNQIQIGDVDAFSSDLRVTLAVANGTMTLTPGTLAFTTGNGSADSTMVFEGTLTEINTALATLTYQGNAGYNSNQGTETLNITVNDKGNTGVDPGNTGDANSEEATHAIGITIAAINDAPTVTVPGTQTVNEATALGITGISFADADVAENPAGEMRVTLFVPNGALTLATITGLSFISGGDGTGSMVIEGTLAEVNAAVATLTYQGNPNFNGSDTISVTVNDKGNTGTDPGNTGDANSEEATTTIGVTVNPINDTPTIAKPADQTVNEDTNLTFTGITFADVDSATGDVTATLSVTNGILTVNGPTGPLTSATGSGMNSVTLVGTVAEVNAAIAGMTYRGNLNFHGADTLSLAINDGGNTGTDPGLTGGANDETASTTVGITVSPVNDAPTIGTSVNVTTPEDTQIGINLTTNASDVDGGTGAGDAAISTYTVQTLPSAAAGTLFLANGTTVVVAGTPLTPAQAAGLIFKPAANFSGGPINFTYITTDSDGADSNVATGAITVTPVNDTPTITAPGAQTVNEDTDLSITGTSVADIDSGTNDVTATISVTSGTLTLAGTVGAGLAVSNDGTSAVTLVGTTAEINAAIASITYRGNLNFHGADTLQVVINDQGNSGSDPGLTGGINDEQASTSVGITVNQVNDPPVATPFNATTPENTTVTVSLSATDPDGGTNNTTDAALDTITITALPQAAQGVLTFSDGTTAVVAGTPLTPAQAADLRFVPATDFNGTVNFTFVATDTAGVDSAPAAGAVIVSSTNTAPSLDTNTGITVNEGQPVTLSNTSLSVSDPDNTGAQLTYTLNTPPSNGQLLKNGAPLGAGGTFTQADIDSGIVTYQHNSSETTSDSFNVTVTDLAGLNTGGAFSVPITVNPVNDAPTVVVPGAQTTVEDTPLAIGGISVADVDAGTDDMTVTVSAPNGALSSTAVGGLTSVSGSGTGSLVLTGSATALNTALAALSYSPTLNFNGAETITVLISDGGNNGADPSSIGLADTGTATDEQASSTIAVTVTPVDDIPVPNTTPGTPDVTIETGSTFTGNITDYFTDPDGGPYTFGIDTTPTNGTLVITNSTTGEFTYTPNPGFEGSESFTFTVDGATIPYPTAVNVQVTILVQNTNVAFIDPSVGQPADTPQGQPNTGLGIDIPGVNFDGRQIQFGDGDLNLQNNNEYIRAVVEDRIGALERQYGAAGGGEVLGEALNTPLENRNNNANIGEVTLSGPAAGTGGFFGAGSSPQFLGLGSLATEAGGTPPQAEGGETENDQSGDPDADPNAEEEEVQEETPVAAPPADETGDAPPPGDQTLLENPDNGVQYAATAGLRFSDQIAAESQRMEQQRLSLLGAIDRLVLPEISDLPQA